MEQKSSTNCSVNGSAKIVVFLILAVVVLASVAGVFYWKFYLPKSEELGGERSEPLYTKILHKFWSSRQSEALNRPKLFSKGDYVVEERANGKYIVVDKVGLTAKVPDGWSININKTPTADTEEYWVDLLSPEAEMGSYLKNGCGISFSVWIDQEGVNDVRQAIDSVKKGIYEPEGVKKDNTYEVVKIFNKEALKWVSPERKIIGQSEGLNITQDRDILISFSTTFPPLYKEICTPAWESFINDIAINTAIR
ncbi:MAG: hypothetical protein PHW31_02720 [Candidatus Pacebacteria bacterium]|nr:hypothetical protein [Candidatus Paceibacterota bacterium]